MPIPLQIKGLVYQACSIIIQNIGARQKGVGQIGFYGVFFYSKYMYKKTHTISLKSGGVFP